MIYSINYSVNEILKDKEIYQICITKVPEKRKEMKELAQCYANLFEDVKVGMNTCTILNKKLDLIVLVQDLPQDIQDILHEDKSIIWLKANDMLMEAKTENFVYLCKVTEEDVVKIKANNKPTHDDDE